MGARSAWKSPFVDAKLLRSVEKARSSNRPLVIRTASRRSTILPVFKGLTFNVYNGRKYFPVHVNDERMIGKKLGEFSPTRTFSGHGANRKASNK